MSWAQAIGEIVGIILCIIAAIVGYKWQKRYNEAKLKEKQAKEGKQEEQTKKERYIEIEINKLFVLGIIYIIMGFIAFFLGIWMVTFIGGQPNYINLFLRTIQWYFIAGLIFLFNHFQKKHAKLAKYKNVAFILGLIPLILILISGVLSFWLISFV